MVEARSDFAYRTKEDRRNWPEVPIETLVSRWLKRVDAHSQKFPRPIRMEIRDRYARLLGLPTRWVELRSDGTLWHVSKDGDLWLAKGTTPIATLSAHS